MQQQQQQPPYNNITPPLPASTLSQQQEQQQKQSPRPEFRSVAPPQSPNVNVYTRQTDSPRSETGTPPQRANESSFRYGGVQQQQPQQQRAPPAISPLAQQQSSKLSTSSPIGAGAPTQSTSGNNSPNSQPVAQTVPWRTQRTPTQQQQSQQQQPQSTTIYNNVSPQQQQTQQTSAYQGPKPVSEIIKHKNILCNLLGPLHVIFTTTFNRGNSTSKEIFELDHHYILRTGPYLLHFCTIY